MTPDILFADYFRDWVETYKLGSVRPCTLQKYRCTANHLKNIAPDIKMIDLNKKIYQQIINRFAETHAKNTTHDFHNQIKSSIHDALDEGLVIRNPTLKVVIKGTPDKQYNKYIGAVEAGQLLRKLQLTKPIIMQYDITHSRAREMTTNWDWLIFLCLGTGIRYSEALGLTPADFDFQNKMLRISKTYDYKFTFKTVNETKSKSSKRHISIDSNIAQMFSEALLGLDPDALIFVPEGQRVFNSTVNNRLKTLCKHCKIPKISVHALRHTHASILLYNGISINAISKRLGHSKVSITQDVYLHIIKELEEKDNFAIAQTMEMLY